MATIKVSKENPRTIAAGTTNETRVEIVDRTFTAESYSDIWVEADANNAGGVQINTKDSIKEGSRSLAAGKGIFLSITNFFNMKLEDDADLLHISW